MYYTRQSSVNSKTRAHLQRYIIWCSATVYYKLIIIRVCIYSMFRMSDSAYILQGKSMYYELIIVWYSVETIAHLNKYYFAMGYGFVHIVWEIQHFWGKRIIVTYIIIIVSLDYCSLIEYNSYERTILFIKYILVHVVCTLINIRESLHE